MSDGTAEGDETITATLDSFHALSVSGFTIGSPSSATVTIRGTDAAPSFGMGSVSAKSYSTGSAITEFQVPAASGGNGAITYSASGLPAGLRFDATGTDSPGCPGTEAREVCGTPTTATSGAATVTITAQDADSNMASGDRDTLTFSVTVTTADTAPDFGTGSVSAKSYVAGSAITEFQVPAATGGNGATTYSASGLPAGLRFDATGTDSPGCTGTEAREVCGTPTSATTGAATVTITAQDADTNMAAGDRDTLSFSVTVAANTAPSFGAGSVSAKTYIAGQAITDFQVPAATGGNGATTYSASGLPAGLRFDATGTESPGCTGTEAREVCGTPTTATSGAVTVTITAQDADANMASGDRDTLTFSVTVNADTAPSFGAGSGVHESHLTPGIRAALDNADPKAEVDEADLTRLYGTALAMNGYVRGGPVEVPPRLPRTLAFASRVNRSKWFAETLSGNSALKGQITRRLRGAARAMDVQAEHLDADSSAIERGEKLRWLNDATRSNESRMISNVRLFTEGVDVPALDAVSFLDPRKSQIDIVQSVGRVMRKAPGKRFGYIVVPVPLDEGEDVADRLSKRGDDYRAVGQVLRALQSHDERLAETPGSFVSAHQTTPPPRAGRPLGKFEVGEDRELELKPVDAASIYTHVAASGLGSPGQMTATTIADAVTIAASIFAADGAVLSSAREVLELPAASDKEVSTVAALLLCNACLLHKRLKSEAKDMAMLAGLDGVARAKDPVERLSAAWEAILDKDYEPVFRPALALLTRLPRDDDAKKAVRVLAERAESLADSLNELGYDHAGPLYHRILGSAASDGAFYTNNVSALMLAGLALRPDLVDWSDHRAATGLRILDPACGTGTLLMAALKTIKDRGLAHGAFTKQTITRAHRRLVEHSIRGMDINYHATQLAASNLTLGAPSVNYKAMSIHTLQHGPQRDGEVSLGSVEFLPDAVAGRNPGGCPWGAWVKRRNVLMWRYFWLRTGRPT